MERDGIEIPKGSKAREKNGSWTLAIILLLFLVLRGYGVAQFAPHNDEVIYAEVATLIASDWQKNLFLYQSGRHHRDYKEPLQYWANALTVGMMRDPLLGCRIWSVLLGAVGLIFIHRWVARIWSLPAAHLTAAMVAVSEYYLYFDSIAINEAFLYGLGAAFLFYTYDFLDRRRGVSGILSLFLLLGLLLTKGSGIQWALLSSILPVMVIAKLPTPLLLDRSEIAKRLAGMSVRLTAIILAAQWLHGLVIPARYLAIRDRKLARGYMRSMHEILTLPLRDALDAFAFYWKEVLVNEFSVLLFPVLALLVAAGISLYRSDRRRFAVYLSVIAIYLFSFAPLLLVAKVRFIRYFGTGTYFLYAALAIAIVELSGRLPPRIRKATGISAALIVLGAKLVLSWIPLAEWGQTNLSFRETPAGWANGSGIMSLIDQLVKLEPGVVVTDPQWGHPTTTLNLYRDRYPQLALRGLTKGWMYAPLANLHAIMKSEDANLYFVFDARVKGARRSIDRLLRNERLCGNKRVIQKRYKDQVMKDSALTICRANFDRPRPAPRPTIRNP